MEISDGEEIYVALMKPSQFSDSNAWAILIPPIRGTYDDYGGINLTESYSRFDLKSGSNWAPRDDERGQPIYQACAECPIQATALGGVVHIKARVFDFLPELKIEFPYAQKNGESVEAATIGKKRDIKLEQVAETVDYVAAEFFKAKADSSNFLDLYRLLTSLSKVLSDDVLMDSKTYVNDEIERRCTDFSEFYEFYGRAYVLTLAQYELRKLFVPGVIGPQHGGEDALLQFSEHVVKLTKERVKTLEYKPSGSSFI